MRGAAALARHWGVPALIVGLTIVAFGTSAPELVVGVKSALTGAGELAAGNVIGSNIANVLLALGLPALIMAIPTNMAGVARNSLVALGATVVFIALAFIANPLQQWQGAILFAGIVSYLIWMFKLAKAGVEDPILEEMTEIDEGEDGLPTALWKSIAFVIAGMIGLVIGGELIVNNAVLLAAEITWLNQAVVGLTIVAIGTSLREIATVIVASYRGHPEVAIGNVLGSNVFNLFAVMGASALAGPIYVAKESLMRFDIWVMFAAMVALFLYVMKRQPIGKKTGALFVLAYILYLLAIARGMM